MVEDGAYPLVHICKINSPKKVMDLAYYQAYHFDYFDSPTLGEYVHLYLYVFMLLGSCDRKSLVEVGHQ